MKFNRNESKFYLFMPTTVSIKASFTHPPKWCGGQTVNISRGQMRNLSINSELF